MDNITVHLRVPIHTGMEYITKTGSDKKSYQVLQSTTSHTIEFSEEKHGPDYKQIAQNYITANEKNVVSSEGFGEAIEPAPKKRSKKEAVE